MNDQSQMMNQSQMMSMSQQLPPLPPPQSQQVMNNNQNNPQMFVNQLMNPSQMMANQSQSMSNRRGVGVGGGYGMWPPPQVDQMKFQNPVLNSGLLKPMGIRNNKNWKMKKGNDKWNNNNNNNNNSNSTGNSSISSGGGAYNPPTLNELQQQNRLKAKRYFPKKKYNHSGGGGSGSGRKAPFAPRNTTSFLIRAKKAGGITSLVSPCPVTPSVLPTPIFSPSREVLVDMAKEEWGVDGYGSMKGLIRLRSPGNEADVVEDEEEDEGGSSESDVEEHVEVERRLDHDLSRFEMIYPNYSGADHSSYNLENRVDDQDTHIAQLEEENLILKERMFLMEREFDDLRMRLQHLERQSRGGERGNNEEVVENDSENESESRGYGRSMEDNNERSQNSEDNNNNVETENKQSDLGVLATDVCMEEDIQKTENDESAEALVETNVSGSNNEETEEANEPAKEEESVANGI